MELLRGSRRDVGTPESAAWVKGAWALGSVCVLGGVLSSPTQALGTEGCFLRLRWACGWECPCGSASSRQDRRGPLCLCTSLPRPS